MRNICFGVLASLCMVLAGCSNTMSSQQVVGNDNKNSFSRQADAQQKEGNGKTEYSMQNIQMEDVDFMNLVEKKQISEDNGDRSCKIHYPYITDKRYQTINQKIEENVKKESHYDEQFASDMAQNASITLDYTIDVTKQAFLSVYFEGVMQDLNAAHPVNLSFALNFDLQSGELVKLDHFVNLASIREQMNSLIKKQVKDEDYQKALLHAWENNGEEALLDEKSFYLYKNKVYFVLKIPAGSEVYESICLQDVDSNIVF